MMLALSRSQGSAPARHARTGLGNSNMLLHLLLVGLLGAATMVNAAMFKPKGPVVQLTPSNFKKEVLDIEKPTFVAFTAPWCGHCQRLAPEYEKAADTLSGVVKFANLDCDADANKPTCSKYGIQSFPTIKMFPPTKKRLPKDYRGERSAKALADYAVGELPVGSVKKLEAHTIQAFADKDPSRVKVLLFTNKPSSSPLYKSLALDFRKSITFASARGDQQVVRAAARTHLGFDIASEKDLPKLIMLPARISPDEDDWRAPDFVKGSFAVYEGKLKFHELKAWIEETGKEFGARKRSDEESKRRSPPEPTWAKPKDQPPPGASPPPGGSFEWRAENIDFNPKPKKDKEGKKPKKAVKEEKEPSMLSRERAQELLDTINKQRKEMLENGQLDKVEAEEFDRLQSREETEKRLQKQFEKSGFSEEEAAKHASAAMDLHLSSASSQAEAEASPTPKSESILDKIKDAASDAAEKVAEKVGDAAQAYADVLHSAADAVDPEKQEEKDSKEARKEKEDDGKEYPDAGKVLMDVIKGKLSKNLRETADDAEELAYNMHGDDYLEEIEDKKPGEVLGAFAEYISGKPTIWSSDMTEKVRQARADAEKLFREDPVKAAEKARELEEWLDTNLDIDKDKMAAELGEEGLKKLENLQKIVRQRRKQRERQEKHSIPRHEEL